MADRQDRPLLATIPFFELRAVLYSRVVICLLLILRVSPQTTMLELLPIRLFTLIHSKRNISILCCVVGKTMAILGSVPGRL
jgi:hypothetical protein